MTEPDFEQVPLDRMLAIDRLCRRHEAGLRSDFSEPIEDLLRLLPEEDQSVALREMLPLEVRLRLQRGEVPVLDQLAARFPAAPRDWLAGLLENEKCLAGDDIPARIGDYEIIERIGSGGMGAVYKAVHRRMGRTVAVKVLRRELQQDPVWLARFDREVRAAARLNHPHIVVALDAREEHGLHCLITEFVDGADLAAVVKKQGPLPQAQAADCILQAARGLDYAHRQGVIHRDIKPANLLRNREGQVKILDMGLARLMQPDPTDTVPLTHSGLLMGTPAYMAPEQARDTRRADERSDIYSLGCTLHYLLTGRPVYSHATQVDAILSHIQQPIPSLTSSVPGISPTLNRVFQKMIAKSPAERFQSAAEVVRVLERLLSPPTRGERSRVITVSGGQTTSLVGLARPAQPPDALDVPATVPSDAAGPAQPKAEPGPPTRPFPDLSAKSSWLRVALAGGGLAVLLFAASRMPFPGTGHFPGNGSPNEGENRFPAPPRHVLEFDGQTGYVELQDSGPTPGQSYTLEAIVIPRRLRTSNIVTWLGSDWCALFMHEGRWGGGRMLNGSSRLFLAEQPIELGRPVHLAVICDGPNVQLFINGRSQQMTQTPYPYHDTTPDLFVGGVPLDRGTGDRFFEGSIDAVRITPGVRYNSDFSPPDALPSDAASVLSLAFDEGSGATTRGGHSPPKVGRIHECRWRTWSAAIGRDAGDDSR